MSCCVSNVGTLWDGDGTNKGQARPFLGVGMANATLEIHPIPWNIQIKQKKRYVSYIYLYFLCLIVHAFGSYKHAKVKLIKNYDHSLDFLILKCLDNRYLLCTLGCGRVCVGLTQALLAKKKHTHTHFLILCMPSYPNVPNVHLKKYTLDSFLCHKGDKEHIGSAQELTLSTLRHPRSQDFKWGMCGASLNLSPFSKIWLWNDLLYSRDNKNKTRQIVIITRSRITGHRKLKTIMCMKASKMD